MTICLAMGGAVNLLTHSPFAYCKKSNQMVVAVISQVTVPSVARYAR